MLKYSRKADVPRVIAIVQALIFIWIKGTRDLVTKNDNILYFYNTLNFSESFIFFMVCLQ